ncbi:response regulator transcription factor [Pedococcus bigeumensis]|uniref:response regulator transcription factor n=1 Tax=Pedococcus bigeumensis TaxID=433644 RepID=UPI002FED40B5
MSDDGTSRPGEGESLLLVEDDRELAALLERLFSEQGYQVDAVRDVQGGLHSALTTSYSVLVVDRRLPDGDGAELVSRLRRNGVTTPALMLTAHGAVHDRVSGLDAGADDYLVKPFESTELLARIRALLRRHVESAAVLPLGAGFLDTATAEGVFGDGRRVTLSAAESALLAHLARRPTRVFSRDELRATLSPGTVSDSLIDTYVYTIRRKLGRAAIRTVRGVGYRAGELA